MSKKKHRRPRDPKDFFGGIRKNRRKEAIIEEVEEGDNTDTSDIEEQLKELNILNLSIDLVVIIIFATFLNLYYLHSLKAETLDKIFNTNFKENFIDTTEFPRIVNTMFLLTTGTFLVLNYTLLQENKYEHREDINDKEVVSSYKAFLATLFAFMAVIISRDNLEV